MNLNLINLTIILIFIFIILEFSNYKSNFVHVLCITLIIFSIRSSSILWDSNLFELNLWKIIFLILILISFFVIMELTQEKTFDVISLLILVLIGSVILILSDNLIILYLGLELQTFSIFILIAKNRNSIKGSEAGLKYFMLGAISSGFFLLSLVILFLYGLDLNLKYILLLKEDPIVYTSIILITVSFCFKLSLFPFHFWIPDIYEGSSWDIVSLVATLPKISMICVLIQILSNSNIILVSSLLSIGIGTLGALNQTKIKRLLAYSGISHMGFIILGLTCISSQGSTIGSLYLIIYVLTMLSMFILIINGNYKSDYIIELGGIKLINNITAITFILLILSIAGIPPLSGFISKWYLIWVVMDSQFNISSFIIIIFSAIGIGYYLRIVKIIYFQKKSSYFLWKNILEIKETKTEIPPLVLGFTFYGTLLLIINFSFIIDLVTYHLANLF